MVKLGLKFCPKNKREKMPKALKSFAKPGRTAAQRCRLTRQSTTEGVLTKTIQLEHL